MLHVHQIKKQVKTCFLIQVSSIALSKIFKHLYHDKYDKVFSFVGGVILLLGTACSKEELHPVVQQVQPVVEQVQPPDSETINKMVAITNRQTQLVKEQIVSLAARQIKMKTSQYNVFVRENVERYCRELVALDPTFDTDNMQINQVDTNPWGNDPTVFGGDVATVVPAAILTRFDAVADKLQVIEDNPLYNTDAHLNRGGVAMENILQTAINSIKNDPTLKLEDKQLLCDAFETAKALVQPKIAYFKTLAQGAEMLGQDLTIWKKRSFFGKVIRAVARVAIAVVAVTIVTALIIKAAPLVLAKYSLLAAKIKSKGALKSSLLGVGKKGKYTIGGASVPLPAGTSIPSSLWLSGPAGVLKAGIKWDTDMSLKHYYKEFDLKFKVKVY